MYYEKRTDAEKVNSLPHLNEITLSGFDGGNYVNRPVKVDFCLPEVVTCAHALWLLHGAYLRNFVDTIVRLELPITREFADFLNAQRWGVGQGNQVTQKMQERWEKAGYFRQVPGFDPRRLPNPMWDKNKVYEYCGPIGPQTGEQL
jgi:hypothetical protein